MTNYDNYSFDYDSMKEDLKVAETKPGQRSNNNSNKYFLLPQEECAITFRLLPPRQGCRKPYAETRLHYIKENAPGFHCLKEKDVDGRWKGNCPICDYYNALYRKADEAKTKEQSDKIKAYAKKLKPVERCYLNALCREMVDPETKKTLYNVGPRILAVGKSLHAKILRAYCGSEKFKQAPLGDVSHPIKGRDFTIVKMLKSDGAFTYPNYDESRFEVPSILGDDEQISAWLDAMWDLEKERTDNLNTYDELREQIDILQGKKEDASVGFNADDYDLPADFGDDAAADPVEQPTRREKPAVFETKVPAAKPAPKKEKPVPKEADVPFDIDLDSTSGIDVDESWVADFQRAINDAV